MSKRELQTYIKGLTKEQLEEQIRDLYNRFREVKEYYDFAFNPKEKELQEQCKFQITREYFPVNGRKAKARRSVAQKWFRRLKLLGVDPSIVVDLMLFNVEIAMVYSGERVIRHESFYRSIFKSFDEAIAFIKENGLKHNVSVRVDKICTESRKQNWPNKAAFERLNDDLFLND